MSLGAVVLLCATAAAPSVDPTAKAALERMFARHAALRTMSYRLHKIELLVNGDSVEEEVAVKLRKPHDVYLASILPRRGQEVIYNTKLDKRKLIVHPGRFPDVTLWLDIRGGTVTSRQHHLVTHTGLGYLIDSVRRGLSQASIKDGGRTVLLSRPVEKVVLETDDETPLRVNADHDGPVLEFAERMGVDPYWFVFFNGLESLDDDVDEGKPYLLPPHYGKRNELFIDTETSLPVRTQTFLADGRLYERYDYVDLVADPVFTDADFDPENPAYGF